MAGALPQETLNTSSKMPPALASGNWADAKQGVEPDQVFLPRIASSTVASVSSLDPLADASQHRSPT